MQVHRGTSLPFLITTHVLTPYHLILLGPLLGKDALLSVVFGSVIAAVLAAGLGRAVGWSLATGTRSADGVEPITAIRAVSREVVRNGPSVVYGLLAGGAIAAWGLSSRAVAPATLCEGRMAAQFLNAIIGVTVALLLNPSPAAMPFIGTYLWKAGLAHAGLVAFFCAAPARSRHAGRHHPRPAARRDCNRVGDDHGTGVPGRGPHHSLQADTRAAALMRDGHLLSVATGILLAVALAGRAVAFPIRTRDPGTGIFSGSAVVGRVVFNEASGDGADVSTLMVPAAVLYSPTTNSAFGIELPY